MRKQLAILGLLLLLAATAAAQDNNRSWLRGSWEGTGYQNDDNTTWTMQLSIKKLKSGRRMFAIDYPSLSCGGRWQLLSINGNSAQFREVLNHGQDKCTDKGLVRIERRGSQLIFLYSNPDNPKIIASAVLNKKKN